MRCPFCLHSSTNVIDSRAPDAGAVIRRRRQCSKCGKRFTTFERVSFSMPYVVKKGGARMEYDRKKLCASMALALRKRPVSPDRIEEAVDQIERVLVLTGEREVRASRIGELVLDALKRLDIIAYIRFASVYFNVNDPESFVEMIHRAVAERQQAEEAEKAGEVAEPLIDEAGEAALAKADRSTGLRRGVK